MPTYVWVKDLHVLTVILSVTLLVVRFYWLCRRSPRLQQRWVRILPHVNDTLLLASGVALVFITHFYPFSPQGAWLTEKLFGVIIYIGLGFGALTKKPRGLPARWAYFILALLCVASVVNLAVTKMPLLLG
ncbi:SirB2 family protein [Nissabacter sp. SGAir0207]|uniref:SirB2 family protein n=1 Tax=Nissabacter sp. SGAir0207 TaxID=2126321 RepID=UPI0010CD6817|nr:SirB2 family protein [Nissabacter sp. SGAir0207]QCR35931.1 siroheme synthase [Nissabacter sp. SGAir0207]